MISRLASATRAAVKSFRRSYTTGIDTAGGSGRWPASSSIFAPVSQTHQARMIASRRISYLGLNNPLCASLISTFVTSTVADGPSVRSNVTDDGERADLEDRFAVWAARADIEAAVDLAGMCSRIVRAFMIDGEAFTHFVVDEAGELRLRLLSAEQVDSSLTRFGNMTGSVAPRIVQGIETDAAGRRVAYWVLPSQPDVPGALVGMPIRIDAADIAHLYEPGFPGQLRGLSPLAPVATRLLELDALEDAALKKAQVNALFTGFVRDLDGTSGIAAEAKGIDPASLSMEPGTLRFLPPGTTIDFTPTTDMSSIEGILRHMTRSTCAGVHIPFILAAHDLSETNFSSAQVGMQIFKRRIRAFQQNHIVAQFLAPLWRRFVLLEVLSGRIRAPRFEADPETYLTAKFLFTGWPALDPLKQAKADVLELNARIRSRAEIISDNGRDPADVDAEIESDPFQPDAVTAQTVLAQPEVSDNAQ